MIDKVSVELITILHAYILQAYFVMDIFSGSSRRIFVYLNKIEFGLFLNFAFYTLSFLSYRYYVLVSSSFLNLKQISLIKTRFAEKANGKILKSIKLPVQRAFEFWSKTNKIELNYFARKNNQTSFFKWFSVDVICLLYREYSLRCHDFLWLFCHSHVHVVVFIQNFKLYSIFFERFFI